jgi:hypothetical protein
MADMYCTDAVLLQRGYKHKLNRILYCRDAVLLQLGYTSSIEFCTAEMRCSYKEAAQAQ